MGAEAGTSLLPNVSLLAIGFLLGRVQFLPIAAQLVDEICALSTVRKVMCMDVIHGCNDVYDCRCLIQRLV